MINEINQLKPLLDRLRLSLIRETIDITVNEAIENKWSYSELLLNLFSREAERREQKKIKQLLSKSNLDPKMTLEIFDFNFNTIISKSLIKELATCNFIENKQNIFLLGPAGIGKTHLANALGHEACRRKYEVYCERTSVLLEWLHSGHGDNTFKKKMDMLIKIPLLILDDFGLIPLNENYQLYLYEIICQRYEKGSMIITSNRDINEWVSVFNNALIATAFMDRIVHKAIKMSFEKGESFRFEEFKNRQKNIFI